MSSKGSSEFRPKIPNFNSFSTLLDRIVIEHVKKYQLELKVDTKNYATGELAVLRKKIGLQEKLSKELRECFFMFMLKSWLTQEYDVIGEVRTFT